MYIGWIDYGVLIGLFCVSIGIGLYHGCIRSKQSTTGEFFIANGQMKILPTSMSLLASVMSAAFLLGTPVEIYAYGTVYLYYIFSWIIGTYLTAYIFIPIFRQIECTSIYEYFEKRFSLSVRIIVTIDFALIYIIYMGVVLYGPSLALSQVTGLNIWVAVVSCGLICTFYTSIGGMKAVIWTDVIQTIMMFLGIIFSIIFGFIDAGGIWKVFETAMNGGRIHFLDISLDPSIRYTIWSIVIGGSLYSTTAYACVQTQAQRFMCVKSTKAAQRVAWINCLLFIIMLFLSTCVGFLIYNKYKNCDPLQAKLISKPDQLYPLFVIETLGRYPGLTGIFISSILSASLSTISSGINSTVTVILEDIYKRIVTSSSISNKKEMIISKALSVAIGFLTILLAYLMSHMRSNILVIVFQIAGSFAAPILGAYFLGLFVRRVNSRSVVIAFILSLIFQSWILIGSTLTAKQRVKGDGKLALSIQGCSFPVNLTQPMINTQKLNPLLPLYSMSFLWYNSNGFFLTIIIALIASLVVGGNDSKSIDNKLIVPWKNIFMCGSSNKNNTRPIGNKNEDIRLKNQTTEEEKMIEN